MLKDERRKEIEIESQKFIMLQNFIEVAKIVFNPTL
jgi:hypothetical protein